LGKDYSNEKDYNNFYGVRAAYTLVVWFALGNTIKESTTQSALLSTVILFLLPFLLDYFTQEPIENKNIKRRNYCLWATVILVAIIQGFTWSGLNIHPAFLNVWVKTILWFSLGSYVFLAFVDWSAFSSKKEIQHRERIKELTRQRRKHESMEDRVDFYRMNNQQWATKKTNA